MPTFRIEEVEDTSPALTIIAVFAAIAILLYIAVYVGIPALIIYIIYRIIKRRKRKKQEIIERQEQEICNIKRQKEEAQQYATKRLMELNELYERGIISKEKYKSMASPLIDDLDLADRHNH